MKRCLDLFCGGGGAGAGYMQAGFDVVGVDIVDRPNYPAKFVKHDALDYLFRWGYQFDLIHASPPCQGYSHSIKLSHKDKLIAEVRELMLESGREYVIENVLGARDHLLGNVIMLCGTMFGLVIPRHRFFETSWFVQEPWHPQCHGVATAFARSRGWDERDVRIAGKGRGEGGRDKWAMLMDVKHYMGVRELAEAIPPCYTKYIGGEYE